MSRSSIDKPEYPHLEDGDSKGQVQVHDLHPEEDEQEVFVETEDGPDFRSVSV